jgi:DNA polymerase mu
MGLRNFADLERYYKIPHDFHISQLKTLEAPSRSKATGTLLPTMSIQVGLALRHDFSQKIPRAEVEEIRAVVMQELERIRPGCYSVITGGSVLFCASLLGVDLTILQVSSWKGRE